MRTPVFLALFLALGGCASPPPADGTSACCARKPAAAPAVAPAGALPAESLHGLAGGFVGADAKPFSLASLAGHPVVVTMGFTSCRYACPRIMADLAALEARLTPAQRERVRLVFVSIDPAHDTPAALAAFLDERQVDRSRWHGVAGPPASTRELAVALGISYRALEGGQFAHSNRLVLLDGQGRIVARVDGLGADPTPILQALAKLAP